MLAYLARRPLCLHVARTGIADLDALGKALRDGLIVEVATESALAEPTCPKDCPMRPGANGNERKMAQRRLRERTLGVGPLDSEA